MRYAFCLVLKIYFGKGFLIADLVGLDWIGSELDCCAAVVCLQDH